MIPKPDPKPEKAKRLTGKAKDKLQHDVMMRDNWTCLCCGEYTEAPPHHIKPVGKGGSDIAENMCAMCETGWNGEPGCHYIYHHGKNPEEILDRIKENYKVKDIIKYFLLGLVKSRIKDI